MNRLTAALALALVATACGDSSSNTDESDGGTTKTDGGTVTIEPKLSVIAEKIFKPKCVACHAATSSSTYASLSLTADKAYEQLVGHTVESSNWPSKYTKRVVAGDTATSAISASVEQRTEIPVILHMPVGTKLTEAEVTAINTWIQNGAQND